MSTKTTSNYLFKFEQLPRYAHFLLSDHLDEYVNEQIRLSYEIEVPLLKQFQHFSPAEIHNLAKIGATDFLTSLANNSINENIRVSLEKWRTNQIPLVDKINVQAEDITLLNHVRSKLLKTWLRSYTKDFDLVLELVDEIDQLILLYNNSSTDAYIGVLKQNIEEESHFSSNIINASPGITFIYDLEKQKEVYINGKVQQVMGFTAEEIIDMPDLITASAYPEDLPVIDDFIKRVIDDKLGKTYEAEYRFKNKQGNYHWLRCYAAVYKRNAFNKPIQLLGVAYEISNEKEIAGALLKREKQLLEAQEIGQIGSFEWDLVNDTTVSTPEVRKIFEADRRVTFEELLLKVHDDDKEKLKNSLSEAFTTGIYKCEYRFLGQKGEKILDSKGIVSFDAKKRPVTLSGTIQDITERKRIEEDLLSKTMELERSNVHLQEFAYVASHDLKEPLRKISIFTNGIISSDWEELPEKTKTSILKIKDASIRMQQLIEGILSYSSLDSQQVKEEYNLQDALQEAMNNLEFKIRETGARITATQLPVIKAIPFQMQQLFQNLLGNALKFSKKDTCPQINITSKTISSASAPTALARPANKYIQIEIADNGIGFDEDSAEKIFNLFQRLHTRSHYEGSGLGLAICRKIVENHGGKISASSEPDKGATFTITLPSGD